MNISEVILKREPLTQGEVDVNDQVGGASDELASQDAADAAASGRTTLRTNLPPDMTPSKHD